jgi:hypothetical protein
MHGSGWCPACLGVVLLQGCPFFLVGTVVPVFLRKHANVGGSGAGVQWFLGLPIFVHRLPIVSQLSFCLLSGYLLVSGIVPMPLAEACLVALVGGAILFVG